jgi:hypothetical protein
LVDDLAKAWDSRQLVGGLAHAVVDDPQEFVVYRIAAVFIFVTVALGLVVPSANAAPAVKLDTTLGKLWTTVLQTPSDRNSFGTGGPAFACWDLGGTVAPFTPAPAGVDSCTVKPGTKIYVAAATVECSTFEGNGTTEAELRQCARQTDAQVAPSVTLDGKTVTATEAETGPLKIVLPSGNLFDQPAGATGLSVAHGWVTLLHPLTPGTHTITIDNATQKITTTILVKPGH